MKRSAVLVLVSLLVGNSVAEAVTIRGITSCGLWIRERREQGVGEATSQFWILGYLSGLAVGMNKNVWGRKGIDSLDNESVYLWVDNYCRANPLKATPDAVEALLLERCGKPGSCPE